MWRKSKRSDAEKACVEIAHLNGAVGVRDSKNPGGEILTVTPAQWRSLVAGIKTGEHRLNAG